ncbi:hypothetical protein GCM10027271_00890 [Saccharopolyspora gloriosae]|uniref:Undecaprenyl-diphosphatase n=1 Tax=Saccharopolyspora gloriosae TaxID=455344 RepID=A0A840NGE4_9PSEU|nr:phosphatase PAP2 family protein [Saccharopolyspora gloriosae]MBB5070644.1 undecaprenyl-diphosphatase [Saccharopolyspora gloriosae]
MSTPVVQPLLAGRSEPNPYVPDVSTDWYRGIAGAGAASPEWFQVFSEVFTEGAIIAFLLIFGYLFWRARRDDHEIMARAALLAPVTVLAYGTSEIVKSFIQEDRPCRAVARMSTIATCPEFGDWSFPSNHSTIAAAAAVVVLCARPSWGWFAVTLGLLTGLSRVFVGVHYPHDVLVGLSLGALVAALLPWLAGLIVPVVERARLLPAGAFVFGPGPELAREDETVQLPAVDDSTVQFPAVRR